MAKQGYQPEKSAPKSPPKPTAEQELLSLLKNRNILQQAHISFTDTSRTTLMLGFNSPGEALRFIELVKGL